MKRSIKSAITIFVVLAMLLLLVPVAAAAPRSDPSALYTTKTQDGVTLALKRYLPAEGVAFHTGAQPVIVMPGLGCNLNYFDIRTPVGENYHKRLPADLASWARGDTYVAKDPMKYYSMVHYLWNQGFDVWCANYRGEGRLPYRSGGASGYSIDELGIYDMRAIIGTVFDNTGKHPVWIGHSMGSSMAYEYLEGCRFGGGWNPHVVSDSGLVAERNGGSGRETLKGFVDMDGPMVPVMNSVPQIKLLWVPLDVPVYINVRPITRLFGEAAAPVFEGFEYVSWFIWSALGSPDLGLINSLFSMNPANMDVDVARYMIEYCVDGMSSRTVSQYADAGAYGKFREDYKNGTWNAFRIAPRSPRSGDGYYYYSDNLAKISLPALVIADATEDVTSPGDIENFYKGKTRNALDEFYVAPDTAHVDVVFGLNAPTATFPKIGGWLKKLCAR